MVGLVLASAAAAVIEGFGVVEAGKEMLLSRDLLGVEGCEGWGLLVCHRFQTLSLVCDWT